MQVGTAQCINKGMQRDYSMDKASQEFAYENRNIRITTTGNESFLSVTNEKSTIPYTPIKVSLSLVSNVDTDKVRWEFFVRALSGTDESVNVTVEFKDINNNIIESKDFSLVKHDTFSYHTNIKAVKATIRSVNAVITNYSASTNVEIVNNCDYIDSNIKGIVVGSTVLGNYLVLFTKDEDTNIDYIYKIDCSDTNYLEVKMLYEGNLGFTENAIECISSYESDKVQKVYWVDGINQPRYINIAVDSKYPETETFNFTPLLNDKLDIHIKKQHIGTGEFESGVIQYFITLYKEYGAESNLAYESPLYYVSPKDRGGEIGEKQTCSFNINIKTTDIGFEGIRVYSMLRTSYNAEPQAKLVYDGLLTENEINIIDEGKGINVAPTDILFLNKATISASTIEQKDNTLFLGDIKSLNITESFTEEISALLTNSEATRVSFVYRPLPLASGDNQFYKYAVNLDNPSYVLKYFKPREYYRIGFQFKTNTGEWSPVLGVRDEYCNLNIKSLLDKSEEDLLYNIDLNEDEIVYVPALKFHLTSSYWSEIISKYNIVEWRAVMAEHNDSTRTVKAQGLVLPTIYNLTERYNKDCYNTPLWHLGVTYKAKHNTNIELKQLNDCPLIDLSTTKNGLLETVYESKDSSETEADGALYLHSIQAEVIGDRAVSIVTQDSVKVFLTLKIATSPIDTYICEPILIVWSHRAFGQGKITCREAYESAEGLKWEAIKNYTISYNNGTTNVSKYLHEIKGINWSSPIFKADEFPSEEALIAKYVPFYYGSEKSIPTPWLVRHLTYNTNAEEIQKHSNEYFIDANICDFISPDIQNVESGYKFRIIGSTSIANSISDYNIISEESVDSKGIITKAAKYNFNSWKYENFNTGIMSFPLWPYGNRMFYVHYWQHSGPLCASWDELTPNSKANIKSAFNLKTKTYANMWYCNNTEFIDDIIQYPIASVRPIIEDTHIFQSQIYKKKYENVLLPKDKILWYKDDQNETSRLEDLATPDFGWVEVEEIKSTTIKNNSSPHCVLDLGNSNGSQYVLPNYDTEIQNVNGIIYEDFNRLNIISNKLGKDLNIQAASLSYQDPTFIATEDSVNVIPFKTAMTFILRVIKTTTYPIFYVYEEDSSFYLSLLIDDDTRLILDITNEDSVKTDTNLFTSIINTYTDYAYIRLYDLSTYIDLVFKSGIRSDNKRELELVDYSVGTPITLQIDDTILTSTDITTYEETENSLMLTPNYNRSNTSKLWLGEFYTPYDSDTFMGGNTDAAINSNVFIPIYGNYTLPSEEHGVGYGLEGDTYYQRWDHLRIFPSGENDINRPIDALSIMIETHKNLDGDIRELRGRPNTITLTEENTNNVLNDVYSQSNNYLTYNTLNKKFNNFYYPTMYVWSLTKQALSTIDTWTQINLVNAFKLDEVRGKLTKIKVWNNKLFAFQDKAISLINFNNQTTISTNEGTPVQIANSGKVSGHYYISTTQGCKNKWSIATSPAGVYFIDSYNKSINLLNDGITSLSTLHLFQDWINENETGVIWNPLESNSGFKSFYDPIRKDVYFSNNQETLCFNELLNQFVSFYDYSKINNLECIDGHIYSIHNNNLYKMFEGDTYCNLFNEQKDYSITYKINKEPFIDKTWTNIEYRADIFDDGNIADNNSKRNVPLETFDTLEVWNEYQKGVANLSKAKCKFRIWRADIPRDVNEGRGLNRIRNPWVMLKLSKETNTDKRMEFHDLLVKYLQ